MLCLPQSRAKLSERAVRHCGDRATARFACKNAAAATRCSWTMLRLTGIGELYAQYEALKERFRREGLFAQERKRRIPRFPRRVALVSARGQRRRRFRNGPSRSRAARRASSSSKRACKVSAPKSKLRPRSTGRAACSADAIVLARGGGSYEDFFAFNLEPVVRAILRTCAPVITGIGHTGDHHLADDVADLACETPSNAAQYIANLWQRGDERLGASAITARSRDARRPGARASTRRSSTRQSRARVGTVGRREASRALIALERRLNAQSPAQRLSNRMQRLAGLRARLETWPARAFENVASTRNNPRIASRSAPGSASGPPVECRRVDARRALDAARSERAARRAATQSSCAEGQVVRSAARRAAGRRDLGTSRSTERSMRASKRCILMNDASRRTFEEKLERIDAIVKELESGRVDLDRAIELFKEGKTFARECEMLLRQRARASRSRHERQAPAQ